MALYSALGYRLQFDSRRLACSLHVPAFSFLDTPTLSLRPFYVYTAGLNYNDSFRSIFCGFSNGSPSTLRRRESPRHHAHSKHTPRAHTPHPSSDRRMRRAVHHTPHIAVHTSAHAASHEDLRMRGRSIQSSTHTQHVIMLPQQRAALALP